MKFFVTGISGFIGYHLAKRLIENGHDVDGLYYHKNDIPPDCFSGNGVFNQVDISSLKKNRYDFVINLAATTSISTDFNPDIYFNNIIFAQDILSTPNRTIYASSTSVYSLNNPYAYSKAFNEYLGSIHGNALGLRFFNCYGPGNNKGIVKRAIDCCLRNEPLQLQVGYQIRDFIYIDDVIDIIVDYLDFPAPVMDVGTGIGTRIRDVVELVFELMRKNPGIVNTGNTIEGQQLNSIAKSMPMKNYTSLREGLEKTIKETLK